MVEYLDSPIPYIIGISRDLWKQVKEYKWDALDTDIIAFDIDNNLLYMKNPLPAFP